MLLPLAFVPRPLVAPKPFAVDLFLVGSNPEPVRDLSWLKPEEGRTDAPIQAALRTEIAPLVAAKRTFVVMDGGDGSIFPADGPWHMVGIGQRSYSGYDSIAETVNGKTRVVERSESEETMTGEFGIRANGITGYGSQTYLHFGAGEGHPIVALMDLNSYRSAVDHGLPQDRQYLPVALFLSDDSTFQTERFLHKNGLRPPGPVLCRTGIPRARDRDVFAFPPAGIVGHYRLVRGEPGWRLEFVGFSRASGA